MIQTNEHIQDMALFHILARLYHVFMRQVFKKTDFVNQTKASKPLSGSMNSIHVAMSVIYAYRVVLMQQLLAQKHRNFGSMIVKLVETIVLGESLMD